MAEADAFKSTRCAPRPVGTCGGNRTPIPFPAEELLPAAIRRTTAEAPRVRAVAPWVPPAWERAIARALSRDPSQRLASTQTELNEMDRATEGRVRLEGRCSRRRALSR